MMPSTSAASMMATPTKAGAIFSKGGRSPNIIPRKVPQEEINQPNSSRSRAATQSLLVVGRRMMWAHFTMPKN
jgi:hypothetical protein